MIPSHGELGTGGASGINLNCEIVTVLSRIWNICCGCGRTSSGHFSQEYFAAGFSMEICSRYAAGSHSRLKFLGGTFVGELGLYCRSI